jgi:hypothetical protein
MRYFTQKFPLTRVPEREPTLERLRSSLQVLQTGPPPNQSLHALLFLPALLGLNLAPSSLGGHPELYDHNGTNYSVLSGYWATSQARLLRLNNEIDGLIMAPILRVMR